MEKKILFPAEWVPQSAVQLTWPHKDTDWSPILEEAIVSFVAIAKEITKREKLLIVCANEAEVRSQLAGINCQSVIFREVISNDSWARDHGGITVFINGKPVIYDFVFNGWGLKYPAHDDNRITRTLAQQNTFANDVDIVNMQPFVLEGGSIETDGQGTLLTTKHCLFSDNRNEYMNQKQIEAYFKEKFGLTRILWLENGYLEGDDTGGHIDTLARFCDVNTIAYVQCADKEYQYYQELKAMENELKTFSTADGSPYRLIPLPMACCSLYDGRLLPASYANFLIINDAVLLPFYQCETDHIAQKALQEAFPDREIVGIDCCALIKQNGSLHCVTMQYPEGVIE